MTRQIALGGVLAEVLASEPRAALATLPTPLHRLDRFSAAVGREIWIKRDDLSGLVFGGNKARKLEYICGRDQRRGVDTLVSVGAPQSNHARSVAAASRILGWNCHLVLGGDRPSVPTGNLALDQALGAHLHFAGTDDWDELEAAAGELCQQLVSDGRMPSLIPMGGSTGVGALGFAAAHLELQHQCVAAGLDAASVVIATSTGGTHAGLSFARDVSAAGPTVIGVGVAKMAGDLVAGVTGLMGDLAALTGLSPVQTPPVVLDGYLGEGYAKPSAGAEAAAALLLRTEAIFTDPVYSAKALHAVIDLARQDQGGPPLIFWHTGGTPALFSDTVGIQRWQPPPVR